MSASRTRPVELPRSNSGLSIDRTAPSSPNFSMRHSHRKPVSTYQCTSPPMYYSPTQSAMEELLSRPAPVARTSLQGKYYSPTTTIQRIDSSSTLGGSLSSSPLTAHPPSVHRQYRIDTGDGPFADTPPALPPKEPIQKAAFPRPMAISQPLRSSSSQKFATKPDFTQHYSSPRQAPPRPLRPSSSRDMTKFAGKSPRSMSSREFIVSPRSVSSRETMREPPNGNPRYISSARSNPDMSSKAYVQKMPQPFPRKMSVASQPSTMTGSISVVSRTRQPEMSQPKKVQTMSTTSISADIKDIRREPKKPSSCLRNCFDCCCCIFGTGACWSDH